VKKLNATYFVICFFSICIFAGCAIEADLNKQERVLAKLEPPDGKVYHGAQAEVRPFGIFNRHVDWEGTEAYTIACGNRPKIIMHYISLDSYAYWLLKDTVLEISQQPYDYIPQIGLDFYSYPLGHGILNPLDITRDIAKGEYDRPIEDLCELLNGMNTPIFLRPGYEFGGNGQGRHASKKHWIDAWKRIYDIFKNKGSNQIAFVWNTLDEVNYIDYYPGDECVDWWAINIFDNHAGNIELIKRFLNDAEKHHKPVMIAESTPRAIGSTQNQISWKKWYQPYFDLIDTHHQIKAFCYINATWKGYPGNSFTRDCRIQSSDFIKLKYKKILSDQKFIHAKPKSGIQ